MASKGKKSVVETQQDIVTELSTALSAVNETGGTAVVVEAPIVADTAVTVTEPVEITDNFAVAFADSNIVPANDNNVVDIEDRVLYTGLTVQKFARAFWKFKPEKGSIRIEQPDGTFKPGNNKCLDSLWLDAQNPRNLTPSPYYLISRSTGFNDLMLQPD